MDTERLWGFLLIGYPITVLIEFPVLWWGLASVHDSKSRIMAACWLTACTYPIVVLVIPIVLQSEPTWVMITVSEIFAPLAECLVFLSVYGIATWKRDCTAIVAANLASFGFGELLHSVDFFGNLLD